MAKVKCDLNNLLIENGGHLPIQQVENREYQFRNINNTAVCTNLTGCVGGLCQSTICETPNCPLINQQQSATNSKQEINCSIYVNSNQNLNKNLFNRSTYFEVIKSNRFKNRKADLKFPRKFVNVIKKELGEDGRLIGTKKLTKTCYLQPSFRKHSAYHVLWIRKRIDRKAIVQGCFSSHLASVHHYTYSHSGDCGSIWLQIDKRKFN